MVNLIAHCRHCRAQDAEKEKLRSALGSAIMVDTPNVRVRLRYEQWP